MQKNLTIQGAILTLAAVWVMLALPASALAGKCGNGVCQKGETTASCPMDCGVVPPPPSSGDDIFLCVTFRDDVNDRLTSDEFGPIPHMYCNDDPEFGLAAIGGGGGGFIFTSEGVVDKSIPPRQIGLDFSDCLTGGELSGNPALCAARDFPNAGDVVDPTSVTFFQFSSDFNFDLLGLPVHPMTQTNVGLTLGFTLDGDPKIKRVINFTSTPREDVCFGNDVTVMRPTNGCWLMFSLDTQEGCLIRRNRGAGRSAKSVIEQGTYHMPFMLMLEDLRAGTGAVDENGDLIVVCP